MSIKHLYPLASTFILIGTAALLYGLHSEAILLSLEGAFLLWFGLRITFAVCKVENLEDA
jgi:hypothetical protein